MEAESVKSVQHLSTLIAEAATFGFDELMIENVIKELVPVGAAKGRIFGAQGVSDAQARFAQEYLKGSGAKLFEKAAQNMVEGASFPTAEQLPARAGSAFAAAGLKGVSAKSLPREPQEDHPQRSAAEGRDRLRDGQGADRHARVARLGQHDAPGELARVTKAGLTSIVSAVPVAVAFTSLGAREAARAKRLATRNHLDETMTPHATRRWNR